MDEAVTVKSPNGDYSLIPLDPDADYFSVALDGSDRSACLRVYAQTDYQRLVVLFASMADEWRAKRAKSRGACGRPRTPHRPRAL